MKKIKQLMVGTGMVLATPLMAAAQTVDSGSSMKNYLTSITGFINSTAVPFLLGIGFLFFVYGMFKYFIAGGDNEEKRKEGKSVIIYSILGFIMIFIFWGVVSLLASSTGLSKTQVDVPVPSATVPPSGTGGAVTR